MVNDDVNLFWLIDMFLPLTTIFFWKNNDLVLAIVANAQPLGIYIHHVYRHFLYHDISVLFWFFFCVCFVLLFSLFALFISCFELFFLVYFICLFCLFVYLTDCIRIVFCDAAVWGTVFSSWLAYRRPQWRPTDTRWPLPAPPRLQQHQARTSVNHWKNNTIRISMRKSKMS